HVFPYSPRPGTFAMRLSPHWPRGVIMARSARLRELSHQRYAQRALDQVGKVKKVLMLNSPGKGARGLSRDYWPVAVEGVEAYRGHEVQVKIRGYDHSDNSRMDGCLTADLI